MDWGTETEKYARATYEVVTENEVDLIGIAEHATIPLFSASPDGYVDEDGIVEIKCPNTTTHIDWMMADEIPEEHVPQIAQRCPVQGGNGLISCLSILGYLQGTKYLSSASTATEGYRGTGVRSSRVSGRGGCQSRGIGEDASAAS